jgi:hypothetical protein
LFDTKRRLSLDWIARASSRVSRCIARDYGIIKNDSPKYRRDNVIRLNSGK